MPSIAYRTTELPNGLRILAEIDPSAPTAAAGFFVKTGARDEEHVVMGVSHFLEHMMFKGSDRRSADEVNREFDDLGADYNASTSHETTVFHAHVLPEFLPRAIDLLSDLLRPALREADFQAERHVVLEEIAMYDDVPLWRLYESAMEAYYGDHPLAHRVLGTRATIRDLARDQMLEYFTRRYSADNTVVALAGNLDFDAAVDRLSANCGAWSRTNAGRNHGHVAPGESDFTLRDARTNRHYFLAISPAPPVADDRRYAADMLAHLLGDHEGSLLYWALVDPGLAEEAQAGYEARDGVGEFQVFASCSPDRAGEVESIIRDQTRRCLDLVTPDDLARLRSKIATAVAVQGERPAGRMKRLGRLWTSLGHYTTLEEELARLDAVTLDDVRAVYESCHRMEPLVIGRLTPDPNAKKEAEEKDGPSDD